MRAATRIAGIPSPHRSQAPLPKPPNVFKHSIDHSHRAVSAALEKSEKQIRYELCAQNCTARFESLEALALNERKCRRSIQNGFAHQNRARKALAENRQRSVQNLQNPLTNLTSSLNSFKAEASVLPTPAGPETTSSCCDDQHLAAAGVQQQGFGSCDHEEGGGIAVDLDEAAHGAFAVTKYLKDVAQGNPEQVVKSFEKDAAELSATPVQFLGKELAESGVAEFASSVGAAGLLLPLAGMAIQAGIEEWQHGSHQLRQLNGLRDAQNAELRTLVTAEQVLPGKPMRARIQAQEVRLDKTQEAIQEAQKTKQIGFSSAASGLSIGLKASSDIALKASLGIKGAATGKGFFALNESAQAGTAAAGAATGLGLVGTLALGPVAGLFATALGVFFTKKTVTKLHQLRGDFELLKSDLRAHVIARSYQEDPDAKNLHSFLTRQGEKRIGFFQHFAGWNKAFMVGSGLYASSAATKAVVAGLAIGGVAAAASNPIGLAAISAVGIAGSIAMGIASLSFFRGHGRQSKYSHATAADHEWVDRKLMTDLHGIGPTPQGPPTMEAVLEGAALPPSSHPGFDMASTCLNYLDKNKSALRDLMGHAATAEGKHSPLEKNITWWKHLSGQVLSRQGVQNFLNSDLGLNHFKTLVEESLIEKSVMLSKKIDHRQMLVDYMNVGEKKHSAHAVSLYCAQVSDEVDLAGRYSREDIENNPPREVDNLLSLRQFGDLLVDIDRDYAKDQGQLELTLLQLKEISTSKDNDLIKLASYMDAGSDLKEVANFLHQGMDKKIRAARGVLFESQLEGARLRDKQHFSTEVGTKENNNFQHERIEI